MLCISKILPFFFFFCLHTARFSLLNSGLLPLPHVGLVSSFTHFQNASRMTFRKGKSCLFPLGVFQDSLSTQSEILRVPVTSLVLYIILQFIFLYSPFLHLLSCLLISGTICCSCSGKCFFATRPLHISAIHMTSSIFFIFYLVFSCSSF